MSRPVVHEFETSNELIVKANELKTTGVPEDHLFVLSHEKADTRDLADRSDTETIGLKEEGLGTAIANVFNSRGDELRNKLREIGLSDMEAEAYEKKLDTGKKLLIVKNDDWDETGDLV